ncbi:beta-ketoacyl synthase N-terminal-like domain-containing protein [Buchnera aphidicola]|uniref:3-oxoacyl-[acyl-carrier-protein] synthase 1 n=1 Tax=Buchnera aphidicola (Aphis nerii) TaxID=1241835 RepID=A0A4D6XNP6_9GAMM|nr:beta-ketoacyl synthase N-terminal-like domain-containing protein [Buchnera aphidicola]QCI18653.1 beta-ketoacyl-[acyl-carrier-protein] synthase I [Buchnera aphidicola (Aphis nerii)]
MQRVVITGFGIISSIGNNKKEVLTSLYNGYSGITFSEEMKELGMRSQVWGNIKLKYKNLISKKISRFMTDGAIYALLSMQQAIKDANLEDKYYQKNSRVGLIIGSGAGSRKDYFKNIKIINNHFSFRSLSPYTAIKSMTSSIAANLSTIFKIYGVNYSINSACATSSHCIGNAFELIKLGKQDLIFAGGSEEVSCELAAEFDAMKALSSNFNQTPTKASRVYDLNRDGFIISGGGGVVVIESLQSAVARSARIYAEIIGYAATSDGDNIVIPSGVGALRCMNLAKGKQKLSIDYLNVHGTSTKIGDLVELKAISKSFISQKKPMISATKSITGHSLGASGVHEIIYTLLMLQYNFIAPSINIEMLEPYAQNMNIIQKTISKKITTAMSNSFGFGGTNVSLILKKY